MKTVRDFIFLDSKITVDGDCSHEIKRHLLLGRKAMTNLDSILKSRNITLLTKVHLVKAMVFPAVMHGCEFWTVRKNEVKCKVFSHVWLFAGQNTGVGSCSLLQGIFPTLGSNLGLPHCRWNSLAAEPQGKPKSLVSSKHKKMLKPPAWTGTWTLDPQIKSLMLYQQSYPGSWRLLSWKEKMLHLSCAGCKEEGSLHW